MRPHYKSIFLSLLFLILGIESIKAQYTVIGTRQMGGTANFGPILADDTADRYSRFAYIYPAASLGNLQHGDTIRSIEFYKDGFGTLRGKAQFRLFIGNSNRADFGAGSTDWKNESQKSYMKKVYDGNATNVIRNSPGYQRFDFDNNGFYVFDTTGGKIHLELLTEFICDSAQRQTITWAYEGSFTVSAFVSSNESKWKRGTATPVDYTNLESINKPHLKINYFKYRNNAEVRNIYCLGTVPVLMGVADTIKAIVQNVGLNTLYGAKCYLQVRGCNYLNDSIIIDSLMPHEERIIGFGRHIPDTMGVETITVRMQDDEDTSDNQNSLDRNVNYNVYSHIDPYGAMAPGGIGFGGSTGDFVARFYSDSARYINQIQVNFGFGGRSFQFGIWESNAYGSLPGKNIYTSDTLTSAFGSYILPVIPKVKIEKNFFVGIRQTSNFNVAFAYQMEEPIRPNVFYFAAPYGDTNWVSFSPGFDYKFNIQPRLQVDNDVALWTIDNPRNLDTFDYKNGDTITPRATFINYGFNDQSTPFPVFFEIRDNRNGLKYLDSQLITLKSNDTLRVTFRKGFSKNNLGQFTCRAYAKLSTDKVSDNDAAQSVFSMVIRNDVACDNIFEPIRGGTYELNRDSIWPICRVINYGSNRQANVQVVFRFIKDSAVIYDRSRFVSLDGGSSQIVVFDTFPVKHEGIIQVQAYTRLGRDSFPGNDTTYSYIEVVKSNDCGVSSYIRPLNDGLYEKKGTFRPFVNVRNYGIKGQDTVPVIMEIGYPGMPPLFRDSVSIPVGAISISQAIFRNFTAPDTLATLVSRSFTLLKKDQHAPNDTLTNTFSLMRSKDLAMISSSLNGARFMAPIDSLPLKVMLKNQGLQKLTGNTWMYAEVYRDQLLLLRDTVSVNLNLNYEDSLEITSKKTFSGSETGAYWVKWFHGITGDEKKANDTLISFFYIARDIDYRIIGLNIPEDGDSLEYNFQAIRPQVVVSNESFTDIRDSITVYVQIIGTTGFLYTQKANVYGLQPGQSRVVNMPADFVSKTTGVAEVQAWISVLGDAFSENDSAIHRIFLIKSNDILVKAISFPTIDSILMKGNVYAPKVVIRNDGLRNQSSPFSISCIVRLNGNMVYINNKSITLNASEEQSFSFDSSLSFGGTGRAEALFFSLLGNDQERGNDTMRVQFTVIGGVGIPSNGLSGLNLYPNPTTGILNISGIPNKVHTVKVLDLTGRTLHTMRNHAAENTLLNLQDLAPGMYLLRFEGKEQHHTERIWLQR
jgi:hypothetical protein